MIYEDFEVRYDAVWKDHDKRFPMPQMPKKTKPATKKDYDRFFKIVEARRKDEENCRNEQQAILKEFSDALALEYGLHEHTKKSEIFNFVLTECFEGIISENFMNFEITYSGLVRLFNVG